MQTIKDYLKEKGLSQSEVARRLGVSSMAVSQLLNGKAKFGKKTAADWSREFGFNPLYLMNGTGEMLLTNEKTDTSVTLLSRNNCV